MKVLIFLLTISITTAVDYKQWIGGFDNGLSIAKYKYRDSMKHYNFRPPGMHVPKVYKKVDNKYYFKSATYYYSKSSISDARANPAFLKWRMSR